MFKSLSFSILFIVLFSICGLTKTKNIVITEKTYKKLTAPGVNHIKLAKNADKRKGIIRVKDSPYERVMFNKLRTRNPLTKELPSNYRKRELQFFDNNRDNLKSTYKSENIDWEQTGPYNVGGRTRALAVDVDNNQIMLAGGVTGGIWRTEDGGESWTKTTASNEHQSVTAVVQDPREGHTNIWYYCTGELYGSASAIGAFYTGAGVFKSVDGGKTWTKFADTDRFDTPFFNELFDMCWNITIDPTNGDLYVATYGGIYKYNFGEETRNFVINSAPTSNDSYSSITDVLCTPSGIKYATLSGEGTVNGIYRSLTGNSNEWTNITPSNFPTNFSRTVLAYAPSNEDILYFLSETPESGTSDHSIWKLSMNENDTAWEDRSANIPEKDTTDGVTGYNSQNSYNMIIKVAPDDENMVFIGGTNLYRSDDGFETKDQTYWIGGYATENDISGYMNHHADQHSLVFFNDGKTLISGHDGGLSKTTDYKKKDTDTTPVDWISLNNGYLTTQAYTIGIDVVDTESFDILSGFQDNGTWATSMGENETHAKNWTDVGTGDGGYCSIHNAKDAYIFSAQRGLVYLIRNTANDWARIDPKDVDQDAVLFINPYEINPNNEAIMYYAGGTDIWRNSDIYSIPKYANEADTLGWEKINSSNISGQISALKSSILPANILYFGTSQGKIYKIEDAHTGQPNTTDITGSNFPEGYINCIELNPDDANELFISFSNYEVESIFHSTDGGTTWRNVSGNLEVINPDDQNIGPSIRYVSYVNTESGPIYFAGTSIGLYSTNELNESTQWSQVSSNVIGNTIVSMVKTRKDGFIVVGTHGNGIYSAKVDPATSNVAIPENRNTNDKNLKIYPNPMVNESRIEFPNDNNDKYRLVVIDASGRIVRIIDNITNSNVLINREQLKPGIHIITLEGEKIYKGKLLVK